MTDAGARRILDGWERGFRPGRARLLGVAASGYRGLLGTREWLYGHHVLRSRSLPCPVVSIGNLTVGGTGKTPAVELAVRTLMDLGHRPAVVSRGYGRATKGVQIVADAASIRMDAEEGGDEPFLLARRLPGVPVVVGINRHDAGRTALERFGITAIVLDDGFQQRTLTKDLEIVMARCREPWGNGRLLPRGPLREPIDSLAHAHVVIATGARRPEDAAEVAATVARYAPSAPVLAAAHVPTECWEWGSMRFMPVERLRDMRVLAFAGVAAPAGFARTLEEIGASVAGFEAFADHHWYTREELAALERQAAALHCEALVTTEKDWVRLRRLPPLARTVYVLGVRLTLLSGETEWRAAFERACPRRT
ncbi:MAG TPA: tetraacyldisaccharide 4'-kinase [Methylomirabilota bacterium]|nr:tetraacyldisaccharide 4'-kinase [Methylomirabilota bacterium]